MHLYMHINYMLSHDYFKENKGWIKIGDIL